MVLCRDCPRCKDVYPGKLDRDGSTGCGYRPKPGQMVRYNCPFYQKEEEKK